MLRRILFTGFLLLALVISNRHVSACGDKFLMLGRSVGYQSLLKAARPASVVLYNTPSLPQAFSNGRFNVLMDVAGHHLSTVSDSHALERALATGKIDLVLADPAVSRQISGYVNGSTHALVIPILFNSAASERATFEKEFGCVLRLPADSRQVIDSLDRAMKLRAKRVAAHSA